MAVITSAYLHINANLIATRTLEDIIMSGTYRPNMAKTRALITETEREQIKGKHGDERRYQATSRVRRRIREEMVKDVAVLEEHHPELLNELRGEVCVEGEE